jgi:replicative DNA helicase
VNWIVPDLLARGDRFLLTGPEGFGKSTLTRQFALALACGLHPFLQTAIPRQRVWMLDMENTRDETGRAMRWMHSRLRLPVSTEEIPLRIEFRIRGINVGSPSDASWLARQVRAYRPDLIVVTPLYKLHRLDITDEPAARTVVDVLDGLREATGAALLVEAHSPLAQDVNGARVMRPYGSSVFIRWPEFGRGLRPGKESTQQMRLATLERFRGDRVTRNIPEQLCSGDPLPWIVDPREDPR